MRVIRAAELAALSTAAPDTPGEVRPQWLQGPFNDDRLDMAMVTVSAGGATPPHVHLGGQVIVVLAGQGFVEAEGERRTIELGDIVVCPPGELHVHGALEDQPLAHISVTTGGYRFPESPGG